MSQSPIPLIDLEKFSSANDLERARVVAEVRKALEEVGFLMIAGHGVSQSLIDRVTNASLTFFDRPDEEKSRFSSTKPGARGYNAMRGRPSASRMTALISRRCRRVTQSDAPACPTIPISSPRKPATASQTISGPTRHPISSRP